MVRIFVAFAIGLLLGAYLPFHGRALNVEVIEPQPANNDIVKSNNFLSYVPNSKATYLIALFTTIKKMERRSLIRATYLQFKPASIDFV